MKQCKISNLLFGSVFVFVSFFSLRIAHADPITGGSSVSSSNNQWPDTVAIIYDDPLDGCTGTLISPTMVLTASHCLYNGSGNPKNITEVIVNTTDRNSADGERIAVKTFTAYNKEWKKIFDSSNRRISSKYDIGIITLQNAATTTARPVVNACEAVSIKNQASGKIAGFGVSNLRTGSTGTLNEGSTTIIDAKCVNGGGCIPGEFKTYSPTTAGCFGDSGGPFYISTTDGSVVAGVFSRLLLTDSDVATGNCGKGIYTRLDTPEVLAWIKSNANITQHTCTNPPKDTGTGGSEQGSGSGSGSTNDRIDFTSTEPDNGAGRLTASGTNQCQDGIDNQYGDGNNYGLGVGKGDGKADYGGIQEDTNGDGIIDVKLEPDPSCFSPNATVEKPDDVDTRSIIPCTDKCTFSDLFRLANNIIVFFFKVLLIPIFVIMIMYAGYQYITAQGNPGKVANLKKILFNMIKGIVLILCAWLIVRTILVYVVSDEFDKNHGLLFFETVRGK